MTQAMPTSTPGGNRLSLSDPLVRDDVGTFIVRVVEEGKAEGGNVMPPNIVDEVAAKHSRGIVEDVCDGEEGKLNVAAIIEGAGTWNCPQTKTRALNPAPLGCWHEPLP